MTVREAELPKESFLHSILQDGDFLDCYACKSQLGPEEIAQAAMAMPQWVTLLMALRNLIVKPLGLTTKMDAADKIGEFPVISRSDHEIIMGFDDSHLDFRISMLQQDGMAYGATWVRRNNLLGKIYLATIMPFHVLIMRNAMNRVSRASLSKSEMLT